jgi:hypothetical protein
MKPVSVAKAVSRPTLTRRIWRVFDYRCPVPVRRARFTT